MLLEWSNKCCCCEDGDDNESGVTVNKSERTCHNNFLLVIFQYTLLLPTY